jgi:hypothetical protein
MQRGKTIGETPTELARLALESKAGRKLRNGIPLLSPKPGTKPVDLALVNQLRDDDRGR